MSYRTIGINAPQYADICTAKVFIFNRSSLISPPSGPQIKDLLDEVAAMVPAKWELIGVQLGVPEHVLKSIKYQMAGMPDHPLHAFKLMLCRWKSRCPPDQCSWATIIGSLEAPSIGEKNLAAQLKCKYMNSDVQQCWPHLSCYNNIVRIINISVKLKGKAYVLFCIVQCNNRMINIHHSNDLKPYLMNMNLTLLFMHGCQRRSGNKIRTLNYNAILVLMQLTAFHLVNLFIYVAVQEKNWAFAIFFKYSNLTIFRYRIALSTKQFLRIQNWILYPYREIRG